MKISVITWDANFREYLHTIDCFGKQDFPEHEYEFLWVDFYSSNSRVENEISARPNARLICLNRSSDEKWHAGLCMNEGVAQAKGDLLVIIDGDLMIRPDFLSYNWEQHKDYHDLALYFRRFDEPPESSSPESRSSFEYFEENCKLTNATNFAGAVSIWKKNFLSTGGYETHSTFAGAGAVSKELAVRYRNCGFCIKWAPEQKIYHPWHQGSSVPDEKQFLLETLKNARAKHHWIIPYAGIDQSWIIQVRELKLDIRADKKQCDEYLSFKPDINFSQFASQKDEIISSGLPVQHSGQGGKIPSPLDRPLIFITGNSRSGTSMLTKIVGTHPDIGILMEQTLQNRRRLWIREPYWATDEALRVEASKYFSNVKEPIIGNKVTTPDVWSAEDIERFCNLFTCFKIVYIVRDPRMIALSRYSREEYTTEYSQTARKHMLLNFQSRNMTYVSSWRQSIESFWRLRDGFPNRVYLVYYEDFCDNFLPQLRKLLEFLDVPFAEELYNWHTFTHLNKNGKPETDLKYPDQEVFPNKYQGQPLPGDFENCLAKAEHTFKLWQERQL